MTTDKPKTSNNTQSGNVFAVLFGAVAMVGVLGVATYNMISGPITTMTRVNQKAMIDTQLMAASKIGVVDATNSFEDYGDCDIDGWVEPREWRDDAGSASPDGVTGSNGGGYIPNALGVSKTDPYGTEYGYCVWNAGSAATVGAVSDCDNDNVFNPADTIAGDGTERRLAGDPADQGEPIMVIYSAGPNRVFESPCRNFVDTTPNDGEPDSPLFEKGGDDIVMSFTYAEASSSAGTGGLWQIKSGDPTVATIAQEVQMRMATGATTGLAAAQEKILDTDCTADTLGLMRFNPLTTSIEVCDSPGTFTALAGGGGGAADALVQDNAETCDGVTDTDPADGIPDDNGKIRYNGSSGVPEFCQDGSWKEMILGSTSATLIISPTNKTNYIFNADTATPPHSDWQTFTIQNTGSVASDALSLVLGNTINFETQNDTCNTVTLDAAGGANDSCTVDIRFKSYIDGTFSGTLTVNANNQPSANLEGNATGSCSFEPLYGGLAYKVACEDTYALVATIGGCDDNVSNPTCSGGYDFNFKTFSDSTVLLNTSSSDGAANTTALVAATENYPAAQFCNDLVYAGHDDWYLPGIDELTHLYNLSNSGIVSDVFSGQYWSSFAYSTGYANVKDMPTGSNSSKSKTDTHRFRCFRRDASGGTTAPPSTPSSKPGYVVLSKGTWDGNLKGSSGLPTGLAAANQYCLDDLTNNDWMGRDNTILNTGTVKAFLCEFSQDCQNFLPDTRYYFANSGNPGLGGAYMDMDSKGRGPGNSNNWSGTNYLGSLNQYWTARELDSADEMLGSNLYWGVDDIYFSSTTNCYASGAWNTNSGQAASYGNPNTTDEQRWSSDSGACATPRHFLCMVHPSEGTATPPPPAPVTEPGFFVMTKGTWDGDLLTASGETDTKSAADKLCYDDLIANNWKGRNQAVIEPNNVEAFIGWNNNSWDITNPMPNVTYYFAQSGDTSVGGAYAETDSNGRGPFNTYPWYALNYFGSVKHFWSGRGGDGTNEYWGLNGTVDHCLSFSSNSSADRGEYGNTQNSGEGRWHGQDDTCDQQKHLICMVHPSSATPTTPLQDPLENGPGYFVITKDTWDADLPTAASNAGLGTFTTGWEAARALCIDDLTNNNWDGRSGATIDNTTVRPFLGGGTSTNYHPLPSQRYYFATSGYLHGSTMGYFDTLADTTGPNDNANWSAANYFNGAKEFWGSRDETSSTLWLANLITGNSGTKCDDYESTSASYTGDYGVTNNTGSGRWKNSGGTCATPRHLVCMVDPSTNPATAMPTPPQHTYSVPGAYTVTIDAGQSVTFKAWGAGGGGGGGSDEVADYRLGGNGGAGGYAEATVTPTVDTTYYIYVGGAGQPGSSAGTNGGAGGSSYASGAGGSGGDDGTNTAVQGSGGGGGGLTVIFADATDGTRIVAAGGGGGGAGSGDNCDAGDGEASPLGSKSTYSFGTSGTDVDGADGSGGGSGGGMGAATGGGGGYETSRCNAGAGAGGDSYSITSIELSGADQSPPNTAEAYYQTGAAIGGDGEDPSTTTPATQGGHGLVLIYFE